MSKDETENKEPKVTIGSIAEQSILDGGTNEDALDAVKAEFPEAKTTLASINWYRNKLRSEGHDVLTNRELKKAQKADEDDAGDKDPLE